MLALIEDRFSVWKKLAVEFVKIFGLLLKQLDN